MIADIWGMIEKLARTFQEALTVRTVYGEPITAQGVTVVPVAEIRFGFGGGGGGGTGEQPDGEGTIRGGSGGGGGGGGGGAVEPTGYIEITEAGSRWVPVEPPQSEQWLRALRMAARVLPVAGRRGIFAAIALVAAQALLGRFAHRPPELPGEIAQSR